MTDAPLTFVTYEDRKSEVIGIQLLILSLAQPGGDPFRLIVYCPKAFSEFRRWATAYPSVEVRESDFLPMRGWEVKPTLLLQLLDEAIPQPIWIDADIMVSRPLQAKWFDLAPGQILTSSDYCSNSNVYVDRARQSKLITARRLPLSLNSCILRVCADHRELLKAWEHRMTFDDFQFGQRNRDLWRPANLSSDQDVLWSLLISRDFAHVPVRQLQSGVDVAQSWGLFEFPSHFRLRAALLGLPPFVHAAGAKPWRLTGTGIGRAVAELQPYTAVARQYVKQIPSVADWVKPRSKLGRALHLSCLGSTTLSLIPLQIAAFFYRLKREGIWWLQA